jgi:hypothetical protein
MGIFAGDDPNPHPDFPNESNLEPVHFASNFFQYLDASGYCPDLNTLIIGRPVDIGGMRGMNLDEEHRLEFEHPYPWNCFIKSYRIKKSSSGSGEEEKIAVAVPVPAHVLRSHQPGCNMLEIIPRARWIDDSAGESWGFLSSPPYDVI